ncbi:hypothetical protein [Burkholderia sp. LMG 13014]|uniref:hypothetical protein n=1 Tax=Burkholderia sp. LMG 13014 TaxID=2709306 RepID=UPI001965A2D5|nr:hypothetical protein [Burkholderia sp. LMG 13014]
MNKLVEAMKQHWDEFGISSILANQRTIATEVNSLYLKTTASGKQREQYDHGLRSFSMEDQQELAKHIVAKIEGLIEKNLPAHIHNELIDILVDNKDIPDIFYINKMVDDHNKLCHLNSIIENWNTETTQHKLADNRVYLRLCNFLINKIDKLIQERTSTALVSEYKTYLKYLGKR